MSTIKRVSIVLAAACCLLLGCLAAYGQDFKLAPAVAVEAEDFKIERGWKPLKFGEGNYCVDIIGFCHTSGERFLHAGSSDSNASAFKDIIVPAVGPYRLWVRYEYMPFTESRFKVAVEQNGKVVAEKIMGAKDNPRLAFEQQEATIAQYDPPWGNEGIDEEVLDVPALAAGPARLLLTCIDQPQITGLTADRNVDCLYLSSDMTDSWRQEYKLNYYRILEAFMRTVGARYEVQYTNRSNKPADFSVYQYSNREPWYNRPPEATATQVAPGQSTAWLPLDIQDTAHTSCFWFSGSVQPYKVSVRAIGAVIPEETVFSADPNAGIFLPPYPGKGEKAISVLMAQQHILAAVKAAPAPGKVPTLPLCYGGCMPYTEDTQYCRNYARLFANIGMRNTGYPTGVELKILQRVGLGPTKSESADPGQYRWPPTPENIATAKATMIKPGALPYVRWFSYGDEISFGEWFTYMNAEKQKTPGNAKLTPQEMIVPLWQQWLKANRPGYQPEDYWRDSWGKLDVAKLHPDSSAEAAVEKPKLYVDSTIFYENVSIDWVAQGVKAVKKELGPDVLCGANYSCYPYYYPHSTMYIKWFRRGAADFGCHSEYFWQLGQVTPMVNGFVSEHFRAGMRFNPKAIIRQYTMPHSPGNTDGDFRRTAFTHLAHGVKNLDFFGIGMNETFTENYIDFRDTARWVAIRDITHSIGLVEDILESSQVVPSKVALLVSDSTERWDHAKIANDNFEYNARNFRDDRLTYHQDRVGIYTALTFAGSSPDILVEEDVSNPQILNGYKVLFLVGDCIPGNLAPALGKWVKAGGVVFATAGVGRYGGYHEANPELQQFIGVASRSIQEKDTFMRTSQELPFLKPITQVVGKGWQFPALAYRDRFTPVPGAQVLATFQDDHSPAMIVRPLGKGKVYFLAALPGMAYLWTGLTNPIWVPDRAAGAHRDVTNYDVNAARVMGLPLAAAGVSAQITTPGYLDARLIRGSGAFFLPIANYNKPDSKPVTLIITPPKDVGTPVNAVSAFCKDVKIEVRRGAWLITLPKLGYGDMVRINVK